MNILVLCTGNSARSILLESILNRLGKGKIAAYSAGSKPAGQVNPGAISLLKAHGYDTSAMRSKSWDEFAEKSAPVMTLVVTVCGNARDETCPMWPGGPAQAHWGVEDPADFEVGSAEAKAAFETAYGLLLTKAEQFMACDPVGKTVTELRDILAAVAKG